MGLADSSATRITAVRKPATCTFASRDDLPLAGRGPEDIDFYVVRENNEGEYSEIGGRLFTGTDREMVVQESIFTRQGIDRILRYAFELASTRKAKHVTSATKSNGIIHTMPYWDERFAAMTANYPDIGTDQFHVDILAAHFVLHPDWFDVVVGSNLFGDILSDLGPAVAGTIGVAPSANINPEKDFPSMFEPVHGSAPDIAGQGIANPIGQIWSGAMMLEHLGHTDAARAIEAAIETALEDSACHTPDWVVKLTQARLVPRSPRSWLSQSVLGLASVVSPRDLREALTFRSGRRRRYRFISIPAVAPQMKNS